VSLPVTLVLSAPEIRFTEVGFPSTEFLYEIREHEQGQTCGPHQYDMSSLTTEAVSTSETSGNFYRTTQNVSFHKMMLFNYEQGPIFYR
jgi:hypothetical protein